MTHKGLFSLLVLTLFLCGCAKVPLYTNLPEKEINEMAAVLLSQNIACDKAEGKDGMWSVLVDSDKMAEAVDLLKHLGYPQDPFQNIGQVFKKSGLVSSPSEERIRFMYALSQEVAETISNIDGVLTARVHIVLQDNDPLVDVKNPASASVFIKYNRGSGVEALSSQIKRLVTNSIQGLEYDKVSIVFVPSTLKIAGGLQEDSSNTQHAEKWQFWVIAVLTLVALGIVGFIGYWYWQARPTTLQNFTTKNPPEDASEE